MTEKKETFLDSNNNQISFSTTWRIVWLTIRKDDLSTQHKLDECFWCLCDVRSLPSSLSLFYSLAVAFSRRVSYFIYLFRFDGCHDTSFTLRVLAFATLCSYPCNVLCSLQCILCVFLQKRVCCVLPSSKSNGIILGGVVDQATNIGLINSLSSFPPHYFIYFNMSK